MSDHGIQLKELRNKVEKLINLHQQLVKEQQQLQITQKQLIQTISEKEKQIADLEEKNKVIKMAQVMSGNNDQNTRDIKLKINEYIREIDKCLALINR
jgi:hypothetical protein